MKRMRSKWAVLAAALILLAVVSAGSAFAAEPVKGKVMIYSSIYLHIIEQLKPVLKKTFPDVDVQWFYGGSEKVIAKLVAEFEQGSSMADLIMIADPAYYLTLKREGRLLQYKSPNAKYVLPAWLDKDGYFSGVRINVIGIAYNKNIVAAKDVPRPGGTWPTPSGRARSACPTRCCPARPLLERRAWCARRSTAGPSSRPCGKTASPASPETAPSRRSCSPASLPWPCSWRKTS